MSDSVAPPVPDHSEVYPQCRCPDCQEKRTEPSLYTAHDMVDAWSAGWKAGHERATQNKVTERVLEQ